jgi:hypothetical protein
MAATQPRPVASKSIAGREPVPAEGRRELATTLFALADAMSHNTKLRNEPGDVVEKKQAA